MKRYYEPALKKANVPLIRFHDLRHIYASLLLEQGENIEHIQSRLGHSSPIVTLNVYAHFLKPVKAVCRLEKTIFEITSRKMVAETKKELSPGGLTP